MILRQDRPTLASVSGICLFLDGINWIATSSFCWNQSDGDNGLPPPLVPRGCCLHRSEVTPALYFPGNQDPHKSLQPTTAPEGSEINHGIHRSTRKRESESTSPFRVLPEGNSRP